LQEVEHIANLNKPTFAYFAPSRNPTEVALPTSTILSPITLQSKTSNEQQTEVINKLSFPLCLWNSPI